MSRQELADASGLSSAAIGYYETGKREPQASTLIAIATALRMTTDELLGYTAPHDDDLIKCKAFLESASSTYTAAIQVLTSPDGISITQNGQPLNVRFSKEEFTKYVHDLQKDFYESPHYRNALALFVQDKLRLLDMQAQLAAIAPNVFSPAYSDVKERLIPFLGQAPFPSTDKTKKAAATPDNDQKEKAAAKDDDQKTESSK